jgi:hypothetical protein
LEGIGLFVRHYDWIGLEDREDRDLKIAGPPNDADKGTVTDIIVRTFNLLNAYYRKGADEALAKAKNKAAETKGGDAKDKEKKQDEPPKHFENLMAPAIVGIISLFPRQPDLINRAQQNLRVSLLPRVTHLPRFPGYEWQITVCWSYKHNSMH